MNIQPTSRASQPEYPNFVTIWSLDDQVSNIKEQIEYNIDFYGESLRPVLEAATALRDKIHQKIMTAQLSPVHPSDLLNFQEEFKTIHQDYNAITSANSSPYFQISSDMDTLSISRPSTSSRSSRSFDDE